jgi:hypothetical protein
MTIPRLGDIRRNFSDTSKARKMLGWKAEIGLAEGLRKTVEQFLSHPLRRNRSLPPERNGFPLYMVAAAVREGVVAREAVPR